MNYIYDQKRTQKLQVYVADIFELVRYKMLIQINKDSRLRGSWFHIFFKAKRKQQVMDMNCDEEKALDQKVSMRLGLILQREDKGRKDHSDEKAAKIRNLSDRQVQKMMHIY